MQGMGVVLAAVMYIVAAVPQAQADSPVRVVVDDVPLPLTPAPVVLDGMLYLPLRPLAQQFQTTLTVDKQSIELRRAGGRTFLLRLDRLEVWSDGVVWTVAEAPVRLVAGTTMVPRGIVEAVFGVLTVWSESEGVLEITTPKAFRSETPPKPVAAVPPPTPVAPKPAFEPEFKPDTSPPLVASGYVSVGLSLGGAAGTSAASQLQFATHEGEQRVDGIIVMSAQSGALGATGTVRIRTLTSLLTVGTFALDDSPLTLYQQGVSGGLYEGPVGGYDSGIVAGSLTGGGSVYGVTVKLPASGEWLMGAGAFFDAGTGATLTKLRVEHPAGDLNAFGELAMGSSPLGSGSAFRLGLTGASPTLTTSLSYVVLSADYPTIGNASLFAGRSGPLLELGFQPTPQWSLLTSAAVLSGASSGLPDRVTYGLLTGYRASDAVGLTAELRATEDTSGGTRIRTTTAAMAMTYAIGRWGVVAGASYVDNDDLLAGTSSATSTFSLRAGYTLHNGLPLWVELSQSTGATEAWATAAGLGFHLATNLDLTATVRQKIYTLPSASWENAFEIGFATPLPTGASLMLGAGLKYTSVDPNPTSYLTLQYGLPLYLYGVPRIGRVEGLVFIDSNGNGRRDADEAGVAGVVVQLDDRSAAISRDDGGIALDGVHEGRFRVAVDEATVPAGLVVAQPRQTILVATGETSRIEFALVPAAGVRGVVFIDENGNGARDPGEQVLEGVAVTLLPSGDTRHTDSAGIFEFLQLLPGEYRVGVDQRVLPPDLTAKDGGGVTLVLQPGALAVVDIPLQSTKPIEKRTFP